MQLTDQLQDICDVIRDIQHKPDSWIPTTVNQKQKLRKNPKVRSTNNELILIIECFLPMQELMTQSSFNSLDYLRFKISLIPHVNVWVFLKT